MVGFARRFSDDDKCKEYLLKHRWPDGFVCPKCGDLKAYLITTRGSVECGNGHQTSLTAGTVMHHSRVPLHKWFYAAWLVTTLKPGISALQFQREMEMPKYESAFLLLHKLRSSLYAPDRRKLSSFCAAPNHDAHWVEVDEINVGGEQSLSDRAARGPNKAIVMVAVEVHAWTNDKGDVNTKAGRCRMRVVPNKSATNVLGFVRENVEPGSRVFTDSAAVYEELPRYGFKLDCTLAAQDPDPLPTLGRVVTNLKRWLIGTHKGAVRKQHLQSYLNEYVYRFSRRDQPWEAFNRALGLAVLVRDRPGRETLYSGEWKHRRNPEFHQQ